MELNEKSLMCIGQKGISINNKNPEEFAILTESGTLAVYNQAPSSSKPQKKVKIPQKLKNSSSIENSVVFSPNGQKLLVTIHSDASSSLLVYDKIKMKPEAGWNRPDDPRFGGISRAKFLANDKIVAV